MTMKQALILDSYFGVFVLWGLQRWGLQRYWASAPLRWSAIMPGPIKR